MSTSETPSPAELVAEAERARVARAQRDARLTPSERLERVDALCRQLASIRRVDEPRSSWSSTSPGS